MFKVKLCQQLAKSCLIAAPVSSSVNLIRVLSHSNNVWSRAVLENPHVPGPSSWRHSAKTEQEFLVKAKQDPDTFGESNLKGPELVDEGDVLEEKHFTEQPSVSQRLSNKKYADMIKAYIRQRKIKEAIDVLEIRMLKDDKVKPEAFIYNLLLGACGRVGYTKKAFMLYNDMKRRGHKVHISTYTALFNACSNSPWPTSDGLTRAKHLYNIMIEKGETPNDTNYNAMIKAFGRCGDLPMAFSLVDEMIKKGFNIKDETMNFLLQSCISDKEVGFRHSLLVWRKLINKNIQPSIYTFNLLLRSVRDCGLGDLETTQDVIQRLVAQNEKTLALESSECQDLAVDNKSSFLTVDKSANLIGNISEQLRPNLIAKRPHLGNIISLGEIKNPEDRLILIGGCKGFLQTMFDHQCAPDIKTLSLLLECIPNSMAAEKEVLSAMRKFNIKPDVDFYNLLIKKRSLRLDYEGARQVLTSIKQEKMRPNLFTYGVLAMGCKTKEEALELLAEMEKFGYVVNAAILGAMLQQACFHRQYDYVFEIMELILKESVPVNKKFLEHLESFKKKLKYLRDHKELPKKEVELFGIFKTRYKTWLTEVQVEESEDVHPWQQYRQTTPGENSYKIKDSARFKARRASLFKVKTSKKVRY